MQPLRGTDNLRIDGKEWKHMAWKFLAQDSSSDLSAPVHFWHCPSCLQSLGDLMLSDQPECLWLTFAMELLALTLPGVLVLMWKLFRSSQINFMHRRITLCSSLASNMCIDKSLHSSAVMKEFCSLLCCPKLRAACPWQDSCNHYPPTLGTHPLGLDYSLGDLWSKICRDNLSPSVSVSQEEVNWPLSSCAASRYVTREIPQTTHISHCCEVHVSLNAKWLSI